MKWTERQKEAINIRNKNLLVSAAAGSGKTAVLVERVIKLIVEDGINVDELLVVTFTKAAASEMKNKIFDAIKKHMVSCPKDAGNMKRQIEKLPMAQISTFDSFAYNLIKEYFYKLNISPKIKVGDEGQIAIIRNNTIDQLFEDKFLINDEDFIYLLDNYSNIKSHDSFKSNFLELYNRLMAMPNPMAWLELQIADAAQTVKNFYESKSWDYIKNEIIKELKLSKDALITASEILSEAGLEGIKAKNDIDIESIKLLLSTSKNSSFEEIKDALDNHKFQSLRAKKDEKELWAELKDEVNIYRDRAKTKMNGIKSDYFKYSLETQLKILEKSHEISLKVYKLLVEFHERFTCEKLKNNLLDFNDVEHLAIKLLSDDNVSGECKKRYAHIFVDEYQDSNLLQEEIINLVSKNNNKFMVGDIKQSIYRFRLAEPDIFKEKYKEYKKSADGKTLNSEAGHVIDLNRNFRSKSSVINSVNHIFSSIMEDYGEDDSLIQGAEEKKEYSLDAQLILLERGSGIGEYEDGDKEKLEHIYFEALECAEQIKALYGKEIYDHKKDIIRPLKYKDIAILLRSIKNKGNIICEVLESQGIPAFSPDRKGYFDTLEIRGILNMLRVIQNSNDDLAMLSILRWPKFGISMDELADIRLGHKENSFVSAMRAYEDEGSNDVLIKKIKYIFNLIDRYRNLLRFKPIDEVLWELLDETCYYSFVGSLPRGKQRQVNLRAFLDKVETFIAGGGRSVYELLKYFQNISTSVDVGQEAVVTDEDDMVEVMTVHKSKGLEYPVVFLCSMGSRFNKDTPNPLGSIDKDLGYAINPVWEKGAKNAKSILNKIISNKNNFRNIEEEIRIFYVALTRAKEKLLMTANLQDIREYMTKKNYVAKGPNSYLDFLFFNDIYKTKYLNVCMKYRSEKDMPIKISGRNPSSSLKDIRKEMEKRTIDEKIKKELAEVFTFRYDREAYLKTQSKLSVSEIKKLNYNTDEFKAYKIRNDISIKTNEVTGAEIGTAYHSLMERLDFKEAGKGGISYIKETLKELMKLNIISADEAKYIDLDSVVAFFNSSLGQKIAMCNHEKEKSFVMEYSHNNVPVLVQGIIDCYFEDKDGDLVIVDYKTDKNIKNIEKRYETQLTLYKEAVEKATGKKVKEAWLYLFAKNEAVRAI